MDLILKDGLWFVLISFGRTVEFKSCAIPWGSHFQLCLSALILLLYYFTASASNMINRFIFFSTLSTLCYIR